MIKKTLFLIFLLLATEVHSQTEIKAMFYNLLNYPTAPPTNRNIILKNILNTYKPDLFMVCELETEAASNDILNFSLSEINKPYNKATFTSNQSNTYSSLQQLLFFNNNLFTLANQNVITTTIRDINHYTLILKTNDYLTNPKYLEIFITHLKASQGSDNVQKRLDMVIEFTNALDNLPTNSFVIFAGDFNFYTSSESGYQQILSNTNSIIMKDVLNIDNENQSWHTNTNYINSHTQATRISNSDFDGYGAGGGLDDRFDFIMLSEEIINNSNLNYISNSYKSYGNNNNCYNNRIDDTSCSGIYNQSLRDNLYLMSDHLPVILSLEYTETLTTSNSVNSQKLFYIETNDINYDELIIYIKESKGNEQITIYNSIGLKIYTFKVSKNELRINIKDLCNGIYYIKSNKRKKIIKFFNN